MFNSYVKLPEGTFGSLQAPPMDHFEEINWTMVESFIQIHYPWLNHCIFDSHSWGPQFHRPLTLRDPRDPRDRWTSLIAKLWIWEI